MVLDARSSRVSTLIWSIIGTVVVLFVGIVFWPLLLLLSAIAVAGYSIWEITRK